MAPIQWAPEINDLAYVPVSATLHPYLWFCMEMLLRDIYVMFIFLKSLKKSLRLYTEVHAADEIVTDAAIARGYDPRLSWIHWSIFLVAPFPCFLISVVTFMLTISYPISPDHGNVLPWVIRFGGIGNAAVLFVVGCFAALETYQILRPRGRRTQTKLISDTAAYQSILQVLESISLKGEDNTMMEE